MHNTDHSSKLPIINCHTHIFTGDHVPPYLAKTFIPPPLHFLLPVSFIIRVFRFYYYKIYPLKYRISYQKVQYIHKKIKILSDRTSVLAVLLFLAGTLLTIQVFFILVEWFSLLQAPEKSIQDSIESARTWLGNHWLIFIPSSTLGKLLLVLLLIIFYKTGRNIIFFLANKIWSVFEILPGPETKKLFKRYFAIARFSFYKNQTRIFSRLRNQYPENTGFIVLPMDMEYMGAGKVKPQYNYHQQMKSLATIKTNDAFKEKIFPFIFADPRRLAQEGKDYFNYYLEDDCLKLNDCFVRSYMEEYGFSGFKIYPALGYYPFDKELLPLWKYAADNEIPVSTNCIKGSIYYRGRKKKEWDYHPVFEQALGNDKYGPLMLPQIKNRRFSHNFTHPLNCLCLLEEKLLRKLVGQAHDEHLYQIFGYTDPDTPLKHDLSNLKICFGHFGGEDEWYRFIEQDRDNYSSQLIKNPEYGITFLTDNEGNVKKGKPEQIWKYVDWYSIICSLMLQYPNVYSDISYILHNQKIYPLIRQTLQNPKLRSRVLFGTDFYLVRNHKSEKHILAEISANLSEQEFDQIARNNPRTFLYNKLQGAVSI